MTAKDSPELSAEAALATAVFQLVQEFENVADGSQGDAGGAAPSGWQLVSLREGVGL